MIIAYRSVKQLSKLLVKKVDVGQVRVGTSLGTFEEFRFT